MTPRARSALLAWIGFAVLQVMLLAATAPKARTDAAAVWLQPHHKLAPAAEGVRTPPPDGALRRLPATPFLPAAPFGLFLPAVGVPSPAPRSYTAGGYAPVVLPPSRAPPALS